MIARVAIGIPYYRNVEPAMMMAFGELCARSAMAGVQFIPIGTRGCYVEDNRNGCVEYAMNMEKAGGFEFTHLLWIDTDMKFPGDALVRLLSHGKDIVGANYRQRTVPYNFVAVYEDGTDNHILEPGLHRMRQMPTGLLLTKFEIYRRMGYPWFPAGLRHQARDDIAFCRKAVEMGYEIWCDHDLTKQVWHIDTQEIGWFTPAQVFRAEDTVPEGAIVQVGAQIDNVRAAEAAKGRASESAKVFEPAGRSAA